MNEQELDYLEAQIPELADAAVKQAYWQALAAGSKVLKAENGQLVEVSPDGSRRIVKQLNHSVSVQTQQKQVIE